MTYAIVYSSQTGNTKFLADAIRDSLPAADCRFFGPPDGAAEALEADRLYVGFWTDRGDCDAQTAAFLASVTTQEVYLFGTAGFGGSPSYFSTVLSRVSAHLPETARPVGSFMCQGRMPLSVRQRYERMKQEAPDSPRLDSLLENFDRALSHPDQADLAALRAALPRED